MKSSKPRKSVMESALDSLSRRLLTYHELETRLIEKGYESSEIKAVLERILEWGYVNDRELALMYSESRLKRYSRRRVQQDMQNRGIESELIEQALKATYSSNNEYEQCLMLAERWYAQEEKRWESKYAADNAKRTIPRELWVRQKVTRKLVQRGYPTDTVRSVITQIGNAREDSSV